MKPRSPALQTDSLSSEALCVKFHSLLFSKFTWSVVSFLWNFILSVFLRNIHFFFFTDHILPSLAVICPSVCNVLEDQNGPRHLYTPQSLVQ